MIVVDNDYFILTEQDDQLWIETIKTGYDIKNFNILIAENPRLQVTHFLALRDALHKVNGEKVEIGYRKPKFEYSISNDDMEATIISHVTEKEWEDKKDHYCRMINEQLLELDILQENINLDAIECLKPGIQSIVASGKAAVKGRDAVIRYIKKPERKPKILEDGKANYFDMNFFEQVKKGDWLGEKIPPSLGEEGVTLKGKVLHPKKGKDYLLHYDCKTVMEVKEENRLVLYARKDGIVEYTGGKVSVGNHLYIDGDIGVETGNIDFDGSVTVKGTVHPNFSIKATNDISILGELGVSNCGTICSALGDVYIKGGIFGNNRTQVEAAGNIYVKHANECFLTGGEIIYIGFYAISCDIKAKHIRTDEIKGSIVGGNISALGSIRTATAGNKAEKATVLTVTGFDREGVQNEFKELLVTYRDLLKERQILQKNMESFRDKFDELSDIQKYEYESISEQFSKSLTKLDLLDYKRKSLEELLNVKGEGQITALKTYFPMTVLEIGGKKKHCKSHNTGTYFVKDNKMHYE
jgi:uncharacterized protein